MLPAVMQNVCLDVAHSRLIDRASLTIGPETITFIVGPSGAGKSLLLRLLHGLLPPSSGTITWANQPVTDRIRRRQAMVFQNPVMLNRSVLANIIFVLRLVGNNLPHEAMNLLKRVHLDHHAHRPAATLSGGERQRLALAKALAVQPEVLFLDEPMSNLDPSSITMIEKLILDDYRQKTKIIMVSHDMGQIRRLADDVVFIHQGRILEHSPADLFFAHPQSDQARQFLHMHSWSSPYKPHLSSETLPKNGGKAIHS